MELDMAKRKGIMQYPAKFLDIAERAGKCLPVEPLKMVDENAAIATRQHFSRFRIALAENEHPDAPGASDLMVRIEKQGADWWLVFVARGLYTPEEMGSDLIVPGIDVLPTQERDYTESLLEVWTGIKPEAAEVAAEVKAAVACTHEWDATESMCLKCGVPYET